MRFSVQRAQLGHVLEQRTFRILRNTTHVQQNRCQFLVQDRSAESRAKTQKTDRHALHDFSDFET